MPFPAPTPSGNAQAAFPPLAPRPAFRCGDGGWVGEWVGGWEAPGLLPVVVLQNGLVQTGSAAGHL